MYSETDIKNKLIKHGEEVFKSHKQSVHWYSFETEINEFINDLDNYPHAFVIACLCDKQIKAERAWRIPFELKKRIGNFEFENLFKLTEKEIKEYFSQPSPLHRFPNEMSKNIYSAIQRIGSKYEGDASKIWSDKPSSAEVVSRLLEFDGFGPKIATITANLLARELKVKFSDYYSIDISVDVHVRRVFYRLGLSKKDSTTEQVIYKARALNPEFPGMLDSACYTIGKNWCRPQTKECDKCFMNDVCPSKV